MIQRLAIKDFRGFSALGLEGLGRVNLLVGSNNCGKTSVLEAIELWGLQGDLSVFVRTMGRRGEVLERLDRLGQRDREAAVSHLFHGHSIGVGTSFMVSGGNAGATRAVTFEIRERSAEPTADVQEDPFEDEPDATTGRGLELVAHWTGEGEEILPLSPRGTVPLRTLNRHWANRKPQPMRFLTTASLAPGEVTTLFDRVVLTPQEELIVEALRTIEPTVERIASVGNDGERKYSHRGGLIVKLRTLPSPIPIGILGDGLWRLLGLALSVVSAEGGILLVDEIDTGLHHTVMDDMWKLVYSTAEKLDVQVFATTHSSDCWTSLARVARRLELHGDAVTIQRIERDRESAVAFTADQMILAAERDIEVR